jgi:hypothetical protein
VDDKRTMTAKPISPISPLDMGVGYDSRRIES